MSPLRSVGRFLPFATFVFLYALAGAAHAANPNALWNIVHGRCVPNEEQHQNPTPCALVDLAGGVARGYVVLKDLVGATQYLVLPTARITGIESPSLLAPNAPDYIQDAWAARRFTMARAPTPLTREDIALAVNSEFGRTQNQLHIHVDCIRIDVRDALVKHQGEIGESWKPFPIPLVGQTYIARRLDQPDLTGVNVFALLAQSSPEAAAHMGSYTLVVAGASFNGKPGFVLLADRADPALGNFASGEWLQDHACALAHEKP